jgi:uncharacterized RDD family membrane protein YckC
MDLTDELRIETPEQIDLEFELAGLGTRTVSWMVDALIKWLLTFLTMIVVTIILGFLEIKQQDSDWLKYGGAFIGMVVLFFWILYDIVFETLWSGQTPGKRTMGARVVRDGGAPVDFTASCIRNFLAMADFLPMGYLLGATLIALTEKRQRLGDMAAGTVIIRERKQGSPARTEKMIEQFASAEITFSAAQLTRCTAEDRRILRSFVQRLFQMPPTARFKLAARLVESMQKRMEMPPAGVMNGPANIAWLCSLLRDIDRKSERGY